jgi:hypothetical protein
MAPKPQVLQLKFAALATLTYPSPQAVSPVGQIGSSVFSRGLAMTFSDEMSQLSTFSCKKNF